VETASVIDDIERNAIGLEHSNGPMEAIT